MSGSVVTTSISIELSLPFGEPGTDSNGQSPLARSLKHLLGLGKPQRDIRMLYFQPNLSHPKVFWLGALLHSAGDRLVFFPSNPVSGFELWHGRTRDRRRPFALDHFTLNADRVGWHLTGVSRRRHASGPRTVPFKAGGGVLWFGLSVNTPAELRLVQRQNVATFQAPDKDAGRRVRILRQARAAVVDHIVALNPAAFDIPAPWHVQFNFAVMIRGGELDRDLIGRLPAAQWLDPAHKTEHRVMRLHTVELKNDVDVVIGVFPVHGHAARGLAVMAWA